MKAVLISIQPEGCENIAKGKKTIEVKKTRPKIKPPFKCYIYCTKAKEVFNVDKTFSWGKEVIGEFVCDELIQYNYDRYFQEYFVAGYIGAYMPLREMCLTQKGLFDYGKGKTLYGWRISNLKIYDKPKELSEYIRECCQPDEIQCENCPYFTWSDDSFCTDKRRTITRPPKNWCYVEVEE